MLALGALAVAGLASAAAAVPAEPSSRVFERHEIVLGASCQPAFLTGSFLGGALADLAVVDLDAAGDRRLRIFALRDGAWERRVDAELRPGVLFVDVASVGGRERLITVERDRLNWFDPETAAERLLVEVASAYNAKPAELRYADAEVMGPSHNAAIPVVDVARDLNGDGRDDLLLPDLDGFWVSTQSSDGTFTAPVKLGPPEPFLDEVGLNEKRRYADAGISAVTIPWYQSRVHRIDYDGDGRDDLVFWNEDHFDVHRQNESGRFDPTAVSFTTEVPFDSDGIYSLIFGWADQGSLSLFLGFRKSSRRTVLDSFRDLDGDGVPDLVTLTVAGRSLLKQRSLLEVHLGTATADGLRFSPSAGGSIAPRRRRAGGLLHSGYAAQRFQDIDGDGRDDFALRDVRMGPGGMARALIGNSVSLAVELYRNRAGDYPDRPSRKLEIRRFAPFAGLGNVFFPPVLLGDVTGDGRADLLVGHSPRELRVFPGVPGPELVARRHQKVAVDLPSDERNTWLADLDRDGRADLLVHHGPTSRAPAALHRLTTWIAR